MTLLYMQSRGEQRGNVFKDTVKVLLGFNYIGD